MLKMACLRRPAAHGEAWDLFMPFQSQKLAMTLYNQMQHALLSSSDRMQLIKIQTIFKSRFWPGLRDKQNPLSDNTQILKINRNSITLQIQAFHDSQSCQDGARHMQLTCWVCFSIFQSLLVGSCGLHVICWSTITQQGCDATSNFTCMIKAS